MSHSPLERAASIERARGIASLTLAGDYDLLLACHDIVGLAERPSGVPETILNAFVGVSSEADGLPLGIERAYWAAEPLATKDAEAAHYRERVRRRECGAARATGETQPKGRNLLESSTTWCYARNSGCDRFQAVQADGLVSLQTRLSRRQSPRDCCARCAHD